MYKIIFHNQAEDEKPRQSKIFFIFTKDFINPMSPEAEKFNGWAAMLGFVAAFGAYATTGQIIPGIF